MIKPTVSIIPQTNCFTFCKLFLFYFLQKTLLYNLKTSFYHFTKLIKSITDGKSKKYNDVLKLLLYS
jgi:hypothetical protein